jgi:hypothetical protein
MSGQDSSQIVIPSTTTLWLAAVGTAAPADESADPGDGWAETGLSIEDGTTIVGNPQFGEVFSHQSAWATRVFKSRDAMTVSVILQQFNKDNLIAGAGGGTVTTVSTGHFKYVPPTATSSTPTAALLDFVDEFLYRLVIPKGRVKGGLNLAIQRVKEMQLPLAIEVEGGTAGVDPWYLLTNDPSFDPS